MACNCFLSRGTCHLADPAVLLLYLSIECLCRTLSLRFDVLLCYKSIVYLHLAIELILQRERLAIPSATQREHYIVTCS